jgi:uncharacterized protein YndB with AHSA1/START domain
MAVYRAFAEPGAMERWLPPDNMTGQMLRFDFREGGSYWMRLVYADPGQGKSAEEYDEVEVRLTRLEEGQRIEQEVVFESQDPAFSGVMRMTWIFQPAGKGTQVTVRAENVPEGVRSEDHQVAMNSSLEKLAKYLEGSIRRGGGGYEER